MLRKGRFSAIIFRVKCALFSSQWQALGSFLSLTAQQICWVLETLSVCFPLGTTPRHQGYRRNSAGSFVSDARGRTVPYWVCCFGSTKKLELCLFVALFNKGFPLQDCWCSPVSSALWLQREKPLGK